MKNYTHLTLYLPSYSWASRLPGAEQALLFGSLSTITGKPRPGHSLCSRLPPGVAEPSALQQYTFPLHFEAVIC